MHDISVALTVTVPAQGAAQVALKARTENYPIADVGVQRDGGSTQRSGIVVLAEIRHIKLAQGVRWWGWRWW